uniref:uncharacterized protein LOC105351317 n=1 Tax=Fragaria vesca subsp. vesca TaxID=101020 RepID=UPI0005C94602|nr:PREDICTED: uncharacterized protein LOC105351317 [Fragaria vesca subsp. vesca]
MKREIAAFVSRCLICQQVKAERQKPSGLLEPLSIPFRGSWDKNLSLMESAYNSNYYSSIGIASFEALYGKQCRTPLCWNEVGEKELCGPELIYDTNEKIKIVRDRIKAAQSRQKSYADIRKKDLEFQVGD